MEGWIPHIPFPAPSPPGVPVGSGLSGTGDLARRSPILSPGPVGLRAGPCGWGYKAACLRLDATARREGAGRGELGLVTAASCSLMSSVSLMMVCSYTGTVQT